MYFQGIQGNIEQDVPKNKWNIALQEAIRVVQILLFLKIQNKFVGRL